MTNDDDDGIVVVRPPEPMTTREYLSTYETTRPRGLAYGRLREPPAPFFSHQTVVLNVARLLADHVGAKRLGKIGVAPIDVVLDNDRALIVQPDVLFVAAERLSIIRNQIWGAPDLTIEVLSPSTETYDRADKLLWYRQYGVRECWLVDPEHEQVAVFDFTRGMPATRRAARDARIVSAVLPDLDAIVAPLFA